MGFICLISINGCRKETVATIGNPTNSSGLIQKKILTMGDSYTIGQSVTEDERFPNKTISILTASGITLKYPSQIITRTGWTTQNLLNKLSISGNVLTPPYDIVTLLIGVNDQFHHVDTST